MTERTYDVPVTGASCGAVAMRQAGAIARADHPRAALVEPMSYTYSAGAHSVKVRVTTNDVPGFYAPWTPGAAHAYAAADSVAAAMAGLRRKRTVTIWKLRASSRDMARPCDACGAPLSGPIAPAARASVFDYQYRAGEDATGYYYPKTKTVRLMHYLCSWGATMRAVQDMAERMR